MFTLTTQHGTVEIFSWGYQLQGPGGTLIDPVALALEPHDLIVTDFSRDGTGANAFTPEEIDAIQNGPGGHSVVAAYLSIGESSEFRDHWDPAWTSTGDAEGTLTDDAPSWLGAINPYWPESRKVRYWDEDWQNIIFNDQGTGWLDTIVAQGFDAAYLDIVDAYYFWAAEVDPADRVDGDPTTEREAAIRMVDFIVELTAHARQTNPDFFVIPQNGIGIIHALGLVEPDRVAAYLDAIGAVAAEDVFFRGNLAENNTLVPDDYRIDQLIDDYARNDIPVMIVDYLNTPTRVAEFEQIVSEAGFYPYAAPSRGLDIMGAEFTGSVRDLQLPPLGSTLDDLLQGHDYDELILAFGGDDIVFAQGGNDTVIAGPGADALYGGEGNDTMRGEGGNDTVNGDAGDDFLTGGAQNDTLSGGADNDTLLGQGSHDVLHGDNGEDLLYGGSGMDTLYGGAEADQLFGQGNPDLLYGGAGNDFLSGAYGNDQIFGEEGHDALRGGNGADTLDGGAGDDILSGALGNDVFIFATGYGADQINSFQDNRDTLRLDQTLWADQEVLSVAEVLSQFAQQASANRVELIFDGGDSVTLVNGTGLTIAQLENDIELF